MSTIRKIALATLVFTAAATQAQASVVYFVDLASTASTAIESVEVARPGSTRFHPVALVREGAAQGVTVGIREGDGGCRRDLRVHFDDGRSATHRDVDLCAAMAVLGSRAER